MTESKPHSPSPPRGVEPTPRHPWLAWGVLIAGLIITVLAALHTKVTVEATAQREFDFICEEIQRHIANRLTASAQLLHGGAGLFNTSHTVTREEWRAFTERIQVEQQLPGIQGIGFALLIPPAQLDQHIQTIRGEGFPAYRVSPEGARPVYSAIIYLEPFSERNLRAFGYDMFSEPIRRAAMEQARDQNSAVLSGKVLLVQETNQDVQAGTLMYVPVYRHGLPIDTVEQRRAALLGWVYSPYRMTDMLNGTLDGLDVRQNDRQISLQVYDGDEISTATLLYDSQGSADKAPASTTLISKITPVDFGGRRWTLRFSQPGGLASTADFRSVWLILFGGTSISLLVFWLTISLLRTRVNARRMADQLTTELRETENKFQYIFDHSIVGNSLTLPTGEINTNQALCNMLGYTLAELKGKKWQEITHPEDIELTQGEVDQLLSGKRNSARFIKRFIHKDGSVVWADLSSSLRRDKDGKILYLMSAILDITARKQAEELLSISETRYRRLFEAAQDGILILDAQTGKIVEVNPFLICILGFSREHLLEKYIWDLGFAVDMIGNLDKFQRLQQQQYVRYENLPLETAQGRKIHVEFVSNVYCVDDQKVIQCNIRDISDRVENELRIHRLNSELEQLANRDGLTGINNHRSLLQLAEREFDVAMRYQTLLSVMFFDIDNFKQINDTFGHAIGDESLIRTIQAVASELRSADLVGRYGGDEFVILLPQTSAQEALSLAERIHAGIAAMRLDTARGALTLTISIGIAQLIHDTSPRETVENLLHRADLALYAAKQDGKNCTKIFESKSLPLG